MQSKACLACHQLDKKVVGSSYYEVADKYRKDEKELAKLSTKVKAGGSGVWGTMPMPPNNVTDDEAKQLTKWILSLKKPA